MQDLICDHIDHVFRDRKGHDKLIEWRYEGCRMKGNLVEEWWSVVVQ
jgi:hypothetical protein